MFSEMTGKLIQKLQQQPGIAVDLHFYEKALAASFSIKC